jgi:DNA polymerase elongation subunit (family B)
LELIQVLAFEEYLKLHLKYQYLYKFTPKNVFKEYVACLYQLRLDYPKTNPLNLIAKLLLNSLYGRFGMIDEFPDISIFKDKNSFNKFMLESNNQDVFETIDLGNSLLVKHRSEDKNQQNMLYGNLETHNTNIAIASAITAYARIHMSQFKNSLDFNLYYSDTDSIYIDNPLPDNLVNSKVLGKMKLENILNKAIFLAPKVYYLITESGNHIYKVKGLSHDVLLTLNNFKDLLLKQSFLEKIQTK